MQPAMKRNRAGVPAEMVHRWSRTPQSCRLCRLKKLRCDRASPCSNCVQRKVDCVPANCDERVRGSNAQNQGTVSLATHRVSDSAPGGVRPRQESPAGKTSTSMSLMPFGSALPSELQQLINPSHVPTDVRLLAKCLPSSSQATALFNHFVCCLQPSFGVIHVPSARRLMNQIYKGVSDGDELDMPGLAYLYSILAGAALAWTNTLLEAIGASQDEAKTAFSAYSGLALASLDGQIQNIPASTTTLLAITTLSYVFSHTDGISQKVHLLRTRQLLTARGMQIHRLDTPKRRQEREMNGYDVVEVELQRRIWWHMVASDWLSSLSGGSHDGTYIFHPKHMSVDYPRNIDDELIPVSESGFSFPPSVPSSMSAFLSRVRLAEVCREVVDSLPSAFVDSPELAAIEIDYELILMLDSRFQIALHNLPIFFKLDPQSVQQSQAICDSKPYIAWQRIFLNIAINTRICRLHRPFHLEGLTNPKYSYSRKMCIQSAEAVLSLRRSMEDTAGLIDLNHTRFWLIVQHAFSAAIVLATDISMDPNPTSPETVKRREDVLAACEMLEKSQGESETLRKAIMKNTQTLMTILQSRIDLPMGPRSSDKSVAEERGPFPFPKGDEGATVHEYEMGSNVPYTVESMQDISQLLPDGDGWGKLWSDVFDANLDLEMPEWSSILEDLTFLS